MPKRENNFPWKNLVIRVSQREREATKNEDEMRVDFKIFKILYREVKLLGFLLHLVLL